MATPATSMALAARARLLAISARLMTPPEGDRPSQNEQTPLSHVLFGQQSAVVVARGGAAGTARSSRCRGVIPVERHEAHASRSRAARIA
jgi:hypothetical protein